MDESSIMGVFSAMIEAQFGNMDGHEGQAVTMVSTIRGDPGVIRGRAIRRVEATGRL